MKDVNITIGRFQPFTKGHLRMCQDGYDKNGYPTVVMMITNKRPDARHPFSDALIKKEIEIVKKSSDAIEEVLMVPNADIVKAGQLLKDNGYVAHLWLCGDDRVEAYDKQANNQKYREQGGYPEDFKTYTGSGRVEGVSGTVAREAIKDGDEKAFAQVMPKGTVRLLKDFRDEITKIQESHQSLSMFLTTAYESILSKKPGIYKELSVGNVRVGDVLRLKSEEELKDHVDETGMISVGGMRIWLSMRKYLGKTAKILEIDKIMSSPKTFVRIDIDGGNFWWPMEIFVRP